MSHTHIPNGPTRADRVSTPLATLEVCSNHRLSSRKEQQAP